jgi:2-keto-4-pentenoate hydratase/2-oxohepta-3-ene-1,7-dioic acid hydratase in catechol pathway
MRIAIFEQGGAERVGIVDGERIQPLSKGVSVLELLAASPGKRVKIVARESKGKPLALTAVTLRSPLRPTSMRDFVNFEAHVEGVVRTENPEMKVPDDWYTAPSFYFTSHTAVFGPGDDIEVPPGCGRLDLELEIGVVVGKDGRDLTPEQAREHIAGLTIYNDFSARDLGAREKRLGLGWAKAKDFANALGPWIVTLDELEPYRRGDRYEMELVASVNGTPLGRDSLASIGWSFEEMLVYASRGAWLRTGDVLGSGTCGAGCLAELWGRNGRLEPVPLQVGDEVTLSVEGIGTLSNRIVAGVEPIPVPPARRLHAQPA